MAQLERASLDCRSGQVALHGKTGSVRAVPGNFSGDLEGWYVGWLDRGTAGDVVFAHHVRADNYESIAKFRRVMAPRLLDGCGFAPAAPFE